jgi:hypothetical protein
MKDSLKHKAFIILNWDGRADPVTWYREIMELMAPDVIVVPTVHVTLANGPEDICRQLRPIAEEYARRMDWGWYN